MPNDRDEGRTEYIAADQSGRREAILRTRHDSHRAFTLLFRPSFILSFRLRGGADHAELAFLQLSS